MLRPLFVVFHRAPPSCAPLHHAQVRIRVKVFLTARNDPLVFPRGLGLQDGVDQRPHCGILLFGWGAGGGVTDLLRGLKKKNGERGATEDRPRVLRGLRDKQHRSRLTYLREENEEDKENEKTIGV